MSQFYSDPSRAADTYALPDCEVFRLTAEEVAETMEDEIYEYGKRHEFRLASMNSRVREKMFACMIEELEISGGWFYWYCFPGCMPEGSPVGPFASAKEAVAECQSEAADSL